MPDFVFTTDNSENNPEEELLFTSLRVQEWDHFIGQDKLKQSLLIALQAAQTRSEALDHVLLYGPPGLGKTTIAHLIAKQMGSSIKITSGTALTKVADVAAILTNIQEGDVLFIDEIHRLPKAVEETLYPAMEDYALDIIIGKGPSAKTIRLDLPKFTLVGATTRFGLLAGPFRDRFGIIHRLEYYQPAILSKIVTQASHKLSITVEADASHALAVRARGTPRIALKLLKRARDVTQIQGSSAVTMNGVDQALSVFSIDTVGLEENDRRLLIEIIEKYRGGPVGLSTIAATMNEDTVTIEEVLEPYLLQIGFIQRTPKGRVITKAAYDHLGIEYPLG